MAKNGRNQLKSTHSPHSKNYKCHNRLCPPSVHSECVFQLLYILPSLENNAKSALEEVH